MKKFLLFFSVAVFAFASCSSNSKKAENEQAEEVQVQKVAIADVLAQGEACIDQEVSIEGTLAGICKCEKAEGKLGFVKSEESCIAIKTAEALDTTLVGQVIAVKGIVKKCECTEEDKKECCKEGEKKDCPKADEKKCEEGEKKCDGPKLYIEVSELTLVAAEEAAEEAPAEAAKEEAPAK